MLFDPLFERFAAGTPLTVMTRALLENTLQAQPLDDLFERLAEKQYTRELLFSTVVATMTLVACRLYKSPRAVYTQHKELFGVTLKCFYEKLQGIELHVMRAMVKDHARRCAAIIEELGGQVPALLPAALSANGSQIRPLMRGLKEVESVGVGGRGRLSRGHVQQPLGQFPNFLLGRPASQSHPDFPAQHLPPQRLEPVRVRWPTPLPVPRAGSPVH